MALNLSQKNAIEFIHGPCLILAGAGSGKTNVIIKKIIHLIHYHQYAPKQITAVTFTNKAANEMKMRLLKTLSYLDIREMNISTFHSLGLKIIQHEIHALQLNLNFTLFDETDQIVLIKKICKQFNISNNLVFLKKINFMISNWKNNFFTPVKAESLAQSALDKQIARIYNQYNQYLIQSNILDFDDLICIPTILLKKNIEIREQWRKKISYLLVDEYQDTSISQYLFMKMLTNKNSNFTLVGDDNQSIYSWRGANPENIFLLEKDFPDLKIIKMEHNYRSSGRILKAANYLISHNINYVQKKLFSQLKYGDSINILVGKNEEDEAEKIAEIIFLKCKKKLANYQDYAILYRGNYQARILEKIFIQKNIPYNIAEKSSFFTCFEIKHLLNYLRVIINPHDDHSFIKIINIPARQIGSRTLQKLENFSVSHNTSLFASIEHREIENFFKNRFLHKIKQFHLWIKKIINISHTFPEKIIDTIINDVKYEDWLSKKIQESKKIKHSIHNINTFSQWLKNMLQGSQNYAPMSLAKIIENITLHNIPEQHSKKRNQVQFMTLHSSKGLEFPSVFITGMCEGILPNHRSIINDNIEEERRLTYVGITRAKKELFFTYSSERNQYGKIVKMLPSRFLSELPQEDLQWNKNF